MGMPNTGYDIILTTDPVGGKNATLLQGTQPIPISKEGNFVLGNCPSIIYYQERNRNFMGGIINVE